MATAIKPKPGVYKGVSYRSQLEIKWAQWFDYCGLQFEYIDTTTHDFDCEIIGKIEIKPANAELIVSAIERIWGEDVKEWDWAQILAGNPPSEYGNPIRITAANTDTGKVLVLVEEVGIDEVAKRPTSTQRYWCIASTKCELVTIINKWVS